MDYKTLAESYAALEATSKRLEKTFLVSMLLKKTDQAELAYIIPLLRGKVFPDWDERKIGIADRYVIKALTLATGHSATKIEESWKKLGDLGDVAAELATKKSQATLASSTLKAKKVYDNIQRLALLEGQHSVRNKVQLIAELLSGCSPTEARYVVRTVLGDLRVGIGDGTMRDAIAWAYLVDPQYDAEAKTIVPEDRKAYTEVVDAVQTAYDKSNDFSVVAKAARKGLPAIRNIKIEVGRPVKVMLALKVENVAEGFKRVGTPAELEYKYDGFRMVIHKYGKTITVFTRRLENVTRQFPEVVDAVAKQVKGSSFIVDGEALGYDAKTGTYLPFQSISQRIKRKYRIEEMAKSFPVELNLFDVLSYEEEECLNKPFKDRRALLESILKPVTKKIVLAKKLVTGDPEKAEAFYQEALHKGKEGIIMKNLEGPYKPGSRVGHMVKVKPTMETLDLVVVGAEWGEGKRSGWLTSFTLACIDEDGRFREIGKVGTGIKELEQEGGVTFTELTTLLRPHIKDEHGREVVIRPQVVIEVKYEAIQKSPTYSSGYALRFPRVVRIRSIERTAEDISSLAFVEELYKQQ